MQTLHNMWIFLLFAKLKTVILIFGNFDDTPFNIAWKDETEQYNNIKYKYKYNSNKNKEKLLNIFPEILFRTGVSVQGKFICENLIKSLVKLGHSGFLSKLNFFANSFNNEF